MPLRRDVQLQGVVGRADVRCPRVLCAGTKKGLEEFSIPYANVMDVEYGQKAGRRVGAAIGYSALLGPVRLLALFSKKRNHYVTVGYTGPDGAAQLAVFEIGKDIVRPTLAILETRSGKKIVFQDDDARLRR